MAMGRASRTSTPAQRKRNVTVVSIVHRDGCPNKFFTSRRLTDSPIQRINASGSSTRIIIRIKITSNSNIASSVHELIISV